MKWNIKKTSNGYLVKNGYNRSFVLNNKYDAENLCNLLNDYENKTISIETLLHHFKDADKQLKQTITSLNILHSDMENLKREVKESKR